MPKYYIKHINDPYLNKLLSPAANLYRPDLPYGRMIVLTVIVTILSILCTTVIIVLNEKIDSLSVASDIQKVYIFVFCIFVFISIFSKYYIVFIVMMYQRFAKSEIRLKSCCYPSCSQYSIIALRKYGTIVGIYLTVKHCINCRPPGLNEFP